MLTIVMGFRKTFSVFLSCCLFVVANTYEMSRYYNN